MNNDTIEVNEVLQKIDALRLTLMLLKAANYHDDKKACALHKTVLNALDEIETAYRDEKKGGKR